jgi:integrase
MKKNISISKPYDISRFTHWLLGNVTIEQLVIITQSEYTRNSLLAMRKDWLIFSEYTQQKGHNTLPASPSSVKQFITDVSQTRKFSTVKRYAVTISNIHQILNYPDPTLTNEVAFLLNHIRRNKQGDERPTTVLTKSHLKAIREQLAKQTDPVSCRDLAVYSIMFECALKRSELRDLRLEQFSHQTIDERVIQYVSIGNSNYRLSQETSESIGRWCAILNQAEGPVFRSIDRHNNISSSPMNDSSIFRILKKASTLLSLPEHLSFSGQSARVGAVAELYKQGYSVKDIQEFGRWHSPVMPHQYLGNTTQAEQEKQIFKSFTKIR